MLVLEFCLGHSRMFVSSLAQQASVCIAAMTLFLPEQCVCPADGAGSLQSNTPDAASNSLQHQGTIASDQKAHDASCIWDDEDFVIGKIPEDPPPFELCH